MAFGKDQSHLQNIPKHGGTYVQRMKYAAQRRERTGVGGGTFYWKDRYDPPDITTDIIRLIPGTYAQEVSYDGENVIEEVFEYFMFREHHNGKRGCICSGGALWANQSKALPCPACVIFWQDWRERKAKRARGDNTKGPNRMSCRDQYAFNVWDYGLYFQMPEVDGGGQIRMNQKTNQPFTHWVKGAANDPRFQGRPWKQGDLRPWPMGTTYKDTLLSYAVQIGKSCRSCGTRDSIKCILKICGNKACGQPIYDPNNCALTDEQKEALESKPYLCPHCKVEAFIDEIIECSHCQQPQRATIFDVDLQVQRMGSKGHQTFLQIFNWSEPRPIQVFDPEVLKTITPMDLPKRFSPTPPGEQMKIFNLTAETLGSTTAPPIIGQQVPPMPQPQMVVSQQPQMMGAFTATPAMPYPPIPPNYPQGQGNQ